MNCDSLILFHQAFKISEVITQTLLNQTINKELKRFENTLRNTFDSISSNLAHKASILDHPKIVLAEKLRNPNL